MEKKKKVIIQPPQPKHGNEKVRPSGERPCPICKETMTSETEYQVTVDLCQKHGAWLDRGELDRLLANVARKGSNARRSMVERERKKGVMRGLFLGVWALAAPGGPVVRSGPPRRGFPGKVEPDGKDNADVIPEGQRPCPVCDETMDTEAMENILVDHCDEHGLWLDEEELQQMTNAVRGRMRRGAQMAARRARRDGAVDANIWGLFAFLK